jgi:hypothetical protein
MHAHAPSSGCNFHIAPCWYWTWTVHFYFNAARHYPSWSQIPPREPNQTQNDAHAHAPAPAGAGSVVRGGWCSVLNSHQAPKARLQIASWAAALCKMEHHALPIPFSHTHPTCHQRCPVCVHPCRKSHAVSFCVRGRLVERNLKGLSPKDTAAEADSLPSESRWGFLAHRGS